MSDDVVAVSGRARLRLADLLAALSLGVDLGFDQPMENILRQCLVALRLAETVGLDAEQRATIYYSSLLIGVGCHTDAHEQAKWFGDDIDLKSTKYDHDGRSLKGLPSVVRRLGRGRPPLHRFVVGLEFVLSGHRDVDKMLQGHAAMARALAREVGLPITVQDAVGAAYERWDGRGWPGACGGGEVPLEARIAQLAEFVEVADRLGGVGAAVDVARKRAGGQFDPALAATFADNAAEILAGVAEVQTWDAAIAAEPSLQVCLTQDEADKALVGVADFVDLKTPYMLGHGRAVAELCHGAAASYGLTRDDTVLVRRAALAQGFGRLGISNAIWDKPGPLGTGERERVRLQPYLTGRILHQSEWLAPIGAVASQVRERMDGSGYPGGLRGRDLSGPARLLAAADVFQSLLEPRPYRPAHPPADAESVIRDEVKRGRLDGDAVAAVLAAAGHAAAVRREYPAGLTSREVEVLRLLAIGLSSRDIADRLVISPKTARNHIEHIYSKTGATNRATVSLFAVQQGLLPAQPAVAVQV